jgi:hypothetical protein
MKASDLRPASDFARRMGVKMIAYGVAGTGKTPLMSTAPRPVLLAVEPGLRSMSKSNVPTWVAYDNGGRPDPKRISEFMDWIFSSHEAKNYDTVGIDSISQTAEVILAEIEKQGEKGGKFANGKAAYGEMSRRTMEIANALYYMPNKHVYMIAKLGHVEEGGVQRRRPHFPGQDLNVKMPHLFDEILYLAPVNIPGVGERVAFRTKNTSDITARDRSGNLDELEFPNLSAIIQKCMQ